MSHNLNQVKNQLSLDTLDWMGEVTINSDVALEGDMIESPIPFQKKSKKENSVDTLDTLDEDISETLLRDLRGIRDKIVHITFPTSSASSYKIVLKDWDLWVCVFALQTLPHVTVRFGSINDNPNFLGSSIDVHILLFGNQS